MITKSELEAVCIKCPHDKASLKSERGICEVWVKDESESLGGHPCGCTCEFKSTKRTAEAADSLSDQNQDSSNKEKSIMPADLQGQERQEQGQPAHHCHAEGCDVPVPPRVHMCLPHWRMVPKAVQDLIWLRYRRGQETDKQPSIEYIATAFVSVSCVALKEGRPLPTLQ